MQPSNSVISCEISGVALVMNGDFNPAIFQPYWFARHKLLSEVEAESVSKILVHPDRTLFELPWLVLHVTPGRIVLTSSMESHFVHLRDLALGSFKLLRHTPIRQIGINVEQHYKVADRERYVQFGHTIAPKEQWRKILKNPGLISMTVVEQEREDGYDGATNVTVERSKRVTQGLFFRVNDHYECGAASEQTRNADGMIRILEERFEPSVKRAKRIIDTMLELV